MRTPEEIRREREEAAVFEERTAPKSDRREEKLSRILHAVRGAGGMILTDVVLAMQVGVADRAPLMALLAELAIDGKVMLHEVDLDEDLWWVDGTRPLRVTPAPLSTPSLEDRIVAALAEAGIDGLGEDAFMDALINPLDEALGEEFMVEHIAAFDGLFVRAMRSLRERGIVRDNDDGCSLTPAEWARRIVDRAASSGAVVPEWNRLKLVSAIEHLLAGTEPEPVASTERAPVPSPAAPTLKTGHAPTARTGG